MMMEQKVVPAPSKDLPDSDSDTSLSNVKQWKPDTVANSSSRSEKPASPPKAELKQPTAEAASKAAHVDSNLSLEAALKGCKCPEDIKQDQALVDVQYYSFDNHLHTGQIVVNKDLADDVKEIFKEIADSKFPIAKVVPICKYDWSDDDSVAADNTSGFNYRTVPATHHLSHHALGRAIDLNPAENPYMDPVRGTDQKYDPSVPGTLTRESPPTVIFRRHGWSWGGTWRRGRDYQHFEKL
jgi:hypothetical protein